MSTLSKQTYGRVRAYLSSHYIVDYQGTSWQCTVKGTLKKEQQEVWVGDYVLLDSLVPEACSARIIDIIPRKNQLSRPKVANMDQVVIVHPLREPVLELTQLDRFLTHASLAGLKALICFTKTDLLTSDSEIEETQVHLTRLYHDQLGYTVLFTSIQHPDALKTSLIPYFKNHSTVLAGLSGAGKSSLINHLNPNLTLRVEEVSNKLQRGTHTTRHVELWEVFPDAWIADTPGFSHLRFDFATRKQIEQTFTEFSDYRESCFFSNCLHEEGSEDCGITRNLDQFSTSRLNSYFAFLTEAAGFEALQKQSSQKERYGRKTIDKKGSETLEILRLNQKARHHSRKREKQEVLQRGELEEGLNSQEAEQD